MSKQEKTSVNGITLKQFLQRVRHILKNWNYYYEKIIEDIKASYLGGKLPEDNQSNIFNINQEKEELLKSDIFKPLTNKLKF